MIFLLQSDAVKQIQFASEHWLYISLGALVTALGAVLASPLILRIYENRRRKTEIAKTDDREIELSKDRELFKIREELRQEVEALRSVMNQIVQEKLTLTQDNFLLKVRIKEQEVREIELNEEVLLKSSEIETLKRKIAEYDKKEQEQLFNLAHKDERPINR